MAARLAIPFLLFAALLPAAAKKTTATARGENEDLILTVTLYIDAQGVQSKLGADLGGHYIVADVKVEPKYSKEITIDRDDFVLRTDKDGERTKPFAPSQIAGRGALVIKQTQGSRSGGGIMMGDPMGYPPYGYPYPGPAGAPPVMMPGTAGAGTGGESDNGEATATVRHSAQDKDNPLLRVLEDKVLPEKKSDKPVAGLLYFGMEQQKMKDLELLYGGKETRITLRFK